MQRKESDLKSCFYARGLKIFNTVQDVTKWFKVCFGDSVCIDSELCTFYHYFPRCSDKGVCAVLSHGSIMHKFSWSGLFLSACGISLVKSMIQNKQVEALITSTSAPIVALIPFAGGGGRWEGVVTRQFVTLNMSGSNKEEPVPT